MSIEPSADAPQPKMTSPPAPRGPRPPGDGGSVQTKSPEQLRLEACLVEMRATLLKFGGALAPEERPFRRDPPS